MASVLSVVRNSRRYGSPFRVARCYAMRGLHLVETLRRRRLARQVVAAMPPQQRERLALMQRDGCAPAGPDQNPALLAEVCTTLRDRAQNTPINIEAGKGKNFWEHLLHEEDRSSGSPFLRLAMQPSVLAMACGYFGEAPYLAGIEVYLSHGTHNERWQESQLWHRDYDDQKMFKLFVYCTDVNDENDGEFTYIPKGVSDTVRGEFFPKRISDEKMAQQIDMTSVRRHRGPAGTCFYIDTRNCYHLGSRVALGHMRVAFTATYLTHASLQPFDNRVRITTPLTEMEELLLRCGSSGMNAEVVHQRDPLARDQGGAAM